MDILSHLPPKASIVILTGAGISAESGLETFRGAGGLWCGHRVEDVATPEAFAHNPALVHEFYNMRRKSLLSPDIQPNPAHCALAELENKWNSKTGGEVLIVTQNIDNLHERAGSQNLLHMHGEILKAFCHHCGHKTQCTTNLDTGMTCATCARTGGIRPDIVWFGEMPYHMDKIERALSECDLFISIGTSGHVYPAAGFVREAQYHGAFTVEFNLEPSNNASVFHECIYGPASKTVTDFVTHLLA